MIGIVKRYRWITAAVLGVRSVLGSLQMTGLLPSNIANMTSLSVGGSGPYFCYFDGYWNTNQGVIVLYNNTPLSDRTQPFHGIVEGFMGPNMDERIAVNVPDIGSNKIVGTLTSTGRTFTLTASPDCNSFSGDYRTGSGATTVITPWTGTKTDWPGFCRFSKTADNRDVTETWSSTRGPLLLDQAFRSKSVTGRFSTTNPNALPSYVTGTLANGVLDGMWTLNGQKGGFRITIAEDCNSFSGTFGGLGTFGNTLTAGSGYWSGTRNTAPAPTPTPLPPACNLTGTWTADSAQNITLLRTTLTLADSGGNINGTTTTIVRSTGATYSTGTIRGVTTSRNVFSLAWAIPPPDAPVGTAYANTPVFITISPDCNNFNGTYSLYDGPSSNWAGTRTTPSAPTGTPTTSAGCNLAGAWTTNYGTMNLTQTGSALTGTYGSGGTLTAALAGNALTGQWNIGGSTGRFQFTIAADCKSFSGTWGQGTSATGGGAWTGTKTQPPA